MMTRLIAEDGHELECWMEPAQGTRRGGLVVLQEIFGVTDQLKGVAARYAAEGYEVAVPALFDRIERGSVVPFSDAPRGRELMQETELDQTMSDIGAAVAMLAAHGTVAVMGFCWGGGLAIRAAQTLEIDCAIAFYGTRLKQYLDRPLRAPLLAHFGETDDHVPLDLLEEVRAALPGMKEYLYPAGHAFANDARPAAYVADAAELAHERSLAFLRQHLG